MGGRGKREERMRVGEREQTHDSAVNDSIILLA